MNSNWYDWFNDEETSVFMQKHYFPNTREMQLEFFRREIIGSRFKLQLGIKDVLKNEPIFGVVSLNNIDHLNRKAEISIIIGEKKYNNGIRKTSVTTRGFTHFCVCFSSLIFAPAYL